MRRVGDGGMAVDEPGGAGYAPLGVGEIYLGYGWIFLLGGLGESDELFPVLCLVKSYQ